MEIGMPARILATGRDLFMWRRRGFFGTGDAQHRLAMLTAHILATDVFGDDEHLATTEVRTQKLHGHGDIPAIISVIGRQDLKERRKNPFGDQSHEQREIRRNRGVYCEALSL
jgi:hypothetical protein